MARMKLITNNLYLDIQFIGKPECPDFLVMLKDNKPIRRVQWKTKYVRTTRTRRQVKIRFYRRTSRNSYLSVGCVSYELSQAMELVRCNKSNHNMPNIFGDENSRL